MGRNLIRLGFNTDRPGNNSNPTPGRQEAAGSPYREVPYSILAKMTRKPVCLQIAEGLQKLMDIRQVYTSKPSDVSRRTWVPRDDGDMMATLILPPLLQDTVETKVYVGAAVYKMLTVEVPIFLHVRDLKPADEGADNLLIKVLTTC